MAREGKNRVGAYKVEKREIPSVPLVPYSFVCVVFHVAPNTPDAWKRLRSNTTKTEEIRRVKIAAFCDKIEI